LVTTRTAAFGTPLVLAGFENRPTLSFPSPTADGLSMFVESNPGDGGVYQVSVATRASPLHDFSGSGALGRVWERGAVSRTLDPANDAERLAA